MKRYLVALVRRRYLARTESEPSTMHLTGCSQRFCCFSPTPMAVPTSTIKSWPIWSHVRELARDQEASELIAASVWTGAGHLVELPENEHPYKQGQILHGQLLKLTATLVILNEQVIRLDHDGIHHQAESMMAGHFHGRKLGPGTLVELQNVLVGIDAYLLLTDEDFQHHLNGVHGFVSGVATYTEFLRTYP